MPKLKLADWAKKNGLSYLTANRHFHAGMIANAQQLDSGTILVEDDSPESNMSGSSSNDAMSLFLKKTVEFSKNNATVEDFAAYVISNFSLKLSGSMDGPRYSRQKPKPEDVQKHFQQFITKSEKPKVNSFIMDPDAFEDIPVTDSTISRVEVDQDLVNEFSQAVEIPTPPPGFVSTSNPASAASTPGGAAGSMSIAESTVTRSVDLNTTPQPINYTGSNNLAFSGSLPSLPSLPSIPIDNAHVHALLNNATFHVGTTNSVYTSGIVNQGASAPCEVYQATLKPEFLNLPHDGRLSKVEDSIEETKTTQPLRSRRGRKPSKR